ncbi:MAG TPA: glycoside hydrolase family 2 protein [Candidatus Blautia stercoravium]|nr:glycoside hydrolase family 2 protein [Candidatus Blautia stercoravium]
MEIRELNENWNMHTLGEENWQTAVVPGSVYTDLLRNQNMQNPYWKDNEDKICALMEADHEYCCVFEEMDTDSYSHMVLRFEGLDTAAEVYLNDTLLGTPCNMHRIWEYEVKALLKEKNTLRVIFRSPLKYIAEAYKKYGNIGNEDTYEGFMHLRKAHYMFGWDWGAHLPDAGIFRPVRLLKIKHARIDSVYIRQEHEEGKCTLRFSSEVCCQDRTKCHVKMQVSSPDGQVWETMLSAEGRGSLVIENPQLWWVNGLGKQPLYKAKAVLFYDNQEVDTWQRRIGLRTMTMRREKDEWGESFAHEINGKAFFAMGADYIPEEHLLGRRSPERTRQLLEDCKLANYNVIRVWGGGFYPDNWFYDLCDELGLAVWQDFMFACSVYELTPEFEANIRQEFIDNVKRLRHHASLGLWCGNNEMEMFVDERCWVTKPSEVRDYLFMYERVIPEILREYDPETFYWPASPSSGGSFDNPNDPNRGDVHYWQVWHGNKPFSEYRKHFFRYASEFGFQSFPCKKTIETISDDPEDWNIFSYIMEKHQRNYGANGKIMNYLQQTYRYPGSFDTLLYASQLLQADAIRYGVEHFRRNRGRCMGAVYWQLNDCWPVISWSSIDYWGRWKALHYYAKRFFAPVMISCQEESWLTQEANMNRQHFEFEKSITLNVTNETLKDREILVKWYLRNAKAEILETHEEKISVPALTSVWMDKTELPQADVFTQYVSFEAWEQGEKISEGSVIFSYPKYFKYQNPNLRYKVEGDTITVQADAYAKSVEILDENEDMVLSDNYFDLHGDSRTVKVLRGVPENIRVRSVYDIR